MISKSEYDFPPNPWALFTAMGHPVTADADLLDLGRGAAVYLYTGGPSKAPRPRAPSRPLLPPCTRGDEGHWQKTYWHQVG